jgi:hypothetical protein
VASDPALIYSTTSPDNFLGLVSWHEGDRLNGIVPHRQPIQTNFDLSKNQFDITQATLGLRPLMIEGACNGHSVMRFDGVDDFLGNAAYSDFGDIYTVTIVAAMLGAAANQNFFDVSTSVVGTGFELGVSTVLFGRFIDSVGAKDAASTYDPRIDTKYHVFTITNTNALGTLYIDGQSRATVAYTSPNPNVLTTLRLGSAFNTRFGNVDIASIFFYNVLRTDTERIALEQNYCRRKFFGTES